MSSVRVQPDVGITARAARDRRRGELRSVTSGTHGVKQTHSIV